MSRSGVRFPSPAPPSSRWWLDGGDRWDGSLQSHSESDREPAASRGLLSRGVTGFLPAPVLETERLVLSPLTVEDADEMVGVLDDERLHEFTGGHPATLEQLQERYRRLVAGPRDAGEVWLNWIVRLRPQQIAVGTVQAGITTGESPAAEI